MTLFFTSYFGNNIYYKNIFAERPKYSSNKHLMGFSLHAWC